MTARRLTNTSTSLDQVVASSSPPKSAPAEFKHSKPSSKETSKSLPVPDQKTEKSAMTTQGVTFASQDKLPKLPIPDLDKSCNKYLASLRPLQSAREHAETEAVVQEFLRAEGPELQEKLKKYATGKSSYIEQFCTLATRSASTVSSADPFQGMTRTSTLTTPSFSISTLSSCSRMIPLRPEIIKLHAPHLSSYLHSHS
jgi:hypothetical protein